jgi:branched-subunit amino acid aminotransferase/4-amino-4-deoxychorismate lyase
MSAGRDVARWLEERSGRAPLVLAPADGSGWFGGVTLLASDPIAQGELGTEGDSPLRQAAAVLERAFFAEKPMLAVVLLGYPDGHGHWALYEDAIEIGGEGTEADAASAAPPAGHALAEVQATSLDEPAFCSAVEATREAILAGDVYVLNLTRRLRASSTLSPAEIFAGLRANAPASMAAAWLHGPDRGVLSASPERFLRVTDREVEIAPVKGTRPRGATPAQDDALLGELAANVKERAEHVMVVDLERNDLGRACVPGSIRVDPLCAVETIGYCHQMVSSVRGLLAPDASLGDLLEATFPCGSVTGAPKIAAMRIAGQLEPADRGFYTGALVVARPGRIDSSVLIRTAEIDGCEVRYGTGCGITVDSDARAEWRESVLKCAPLLGEAAYGPGETAHGPGEAGESAYGAGSTEALGSAVPGAPATGPAVALKETCRAVGGQVPLWPWHRARLEGAGVSAATLARIDASVAEKAAEWADAETRRARLTVVLGPDGAVDVRVTRTLSSLDVPGGPLVARVDVAGLPPLPDPPGKPADRSWWDVAHKRAAALGAHQAIMVAPDGSVIDGSTSAVWIVERGELVTPPAPPAIPSVSVAFVRERAADAGLAVRVELITWERFEAAQEAFLTNAFGGAVAVRGRGGEVFSAVAKLFAEVWRR